MGILSKALETLGKTGTFRRDVHIGESVFTLQVMKPEDSILADALTDMEGYLKEQGLEGFKSYATMVNRFNMVNRLAFIIYAVDGQPVVQPGVPRNVQMEQVIEFRNDLLKLDTVVQERLNMEYNKLLEERAKFFEAPVENASK